MTSFSHLGLTTLMLKQCIVGVAGRLLINIFSNVSIVPNAYDTAARRHYLLHLQFASPLLMFMLTRVSLLVVFIDD